jgi:hypothetical protein
MGSKPLCVQCFPSLHHTTNVPFSTPITLSNSFSSSFSSSSPLSPRSSSSSSSSESFCFIGQSDGHINIIKLNEKKEIFSWKVRKQNPNFFVLFYDVLFLFIFELIYFFCTVYKPIT